ncbi:zinc metalloprotease HtpX [Gammaproteobacteria bacterium]|nr:zinc metalloprotease HtpX [Gammaproteobacteria bacterium]
MVSDWRQIALHNRRKTYGAIISFLFVYILLGSVIALAISPQIFEYADIPIVLMQDRSLIIIAILFGFALLAVLVAIFFGARVSLSGTKSTIVTLDTPDPMMRQLYHVVEEMKVSSGMRYMPKIHVLEVNYMNAFAAGWNEKHALVAITKPLLAALSREELQAVMAHELSHIQNCDTQVMTVVSVLSAISVLVIDMMFRSMIYSTGRHRSRQNNTRGGLVLVVVMLLRILLPILTAFLVMYVSRSREMLADAGSTKMTRNPEALAQALLKIHRFHQKEDAAEAYAQTQHNSMRSLAYMYDPNALKKIDRWDVNAYFATHPTISERLRSLKMLHLLKE